MRKKFDIYMLAIVPFIILVVMFLFVPLISMVIKSFVSPDTGGFTFNNYVSIFTRKYYITSIQNSILVSLASTIAGIIIAFLAAFCANTLPPKLKNGFTVILNMTSNFAGVTLAFSFMLLLGKTGMLINIGKSIGLKGLADFDFYSLTGLMMTYIYFQIPLATLLMIPAFSSIKNEWRESALILRATNLQFWLKVGIPVLAPSIAGTISILFANSLSAYGTAYALLSNNFALLPIRIAAMFSGDVVQQVELGSALSTILAVLMCVTVVVNMKFMQKGENK